MLYYYPNRPMLIPPDPERPLNPRPKYLTDIEKAGRHVAELKFNGENTLIMIDDDYKIEFWNRRKERLKRYRPSDETLREIKKKFPSNSIINAELMNNKVASTDWKDILMVHCVMRWDGELLLGKTWGDSRKIVDTIKEGNHIRVSKTHTSGFFKLFKGADGKLIEGIVLKDPMGLLQFSTTPLKDVFWMMKVRKPRRGNYGF